MTCTNCTKRPTTPYWGGYTAGCSDCAAALVITARPLKHLQNGHLYQATRRGLLAQDEILAAVKACKAKE